VGMGGHGGGGGHRSQPSDEEREEMAEIFRPPNSLTFTQNEPEIRVMDDQGNARTYYTDGRKIEKSKGGNNQTLAATWTEYKLTAQEKGPKDMKIERSYEVAPGGQQLWETVHFTVGKSKAPVTIRFVYEKGLGPRARPASDREPQ